MTLKFENNFNSTVTSSSNSAAYQSAVLGVENFLSSQLTTIGGDVTLKINWRYDTKDANGNAFSPNTLANNIFGNNLHEVSYSDIRTALLSHVDSNNSDPGDDAAFTGALPATDPGFNSNPGTNTVHWWLSRGQEKLLGLSRRGRRRRRRGQRPGYIRHAEQRLPFRLRSLGRHHRGPDRRLRGHRARADGSVDGPLHVRRRAVQRQRRQSDRDQQLQPDGPAALPVGGERRPGPDHLRDRRQQHHFFQRFAGRPEFQPGARQQRRHRRPGRRAPRRATPSPIRPPA